MVDDHRAVRSDGRRPSAHAIPAGHRDGVRPHQQAAAGAETKRVIGHGPGQLTVPLGVPATIDTSAGTLTVEPGVR
jgi:hypothetical protein